MSYFNGYVDVSDMLGQTISKINGMESGSNQIDIYTNEAHYVFYHDQECCESVHLEDVIGDPNDLIGKPLLMAEAVHNAECDKEMHGACEEWTFYKFATINGYVTLRWYGDSNGYYSTSVDIEKKSLNEKS